MDGSWSSTTDAQVLTPPSLYASYAVGRGAIGVAIGVPFGAGVSWPGDWTGRFEIVSSSIQDVRVAPFAAWRFGALRVSAGLHVDLGRLQLARKLDFIDSEGNVSLDMSGVGVGADASIFWNVSPRVDVGLTFKSRTALSLSGSAIFSGVPGEIQGMAHDQDVSTSLTLPDRLAAGIHVRAARGLDLYGDVEVETWDSYGRLSVVFADPNTPTVNQTNDWHTTVAARVGAAWRPRPSRTLELRAGAFYDPSPAPSSTLSPTSPDGDRVGLTLGAGIPLGRSFRLDAFYEYMQILSRDSMDVDSLAASYGGSAHLFGVELTYASGTR
jgi:long-chain fatty acid transport protein